MKNFLIFFLMGCLSGSAEIPSLEVLSSTTEGPVRVDIFSGKVESVSLKVRGVECIQLTGRLFQRAGSILAPVSEVETLKVNPEGVFQVNFNLPVLPVVTEYFFVFDHDALPEIRVMSYPQDWLSSLGKGRKVGLISPPDFLVSALRDLKISVEVIENLDGFEGEVIVSFAEDFLPSDEISKKRLIAVRTPGDDVSEIWTSTQSSGWEIKVPHFYFSKDRLKTAQGHATLARLLFQNPK